MKCKSLKPHTVLFGAALILFLIFLSYIYMVNHRERIDNEEIVNEFLNAGLTRDQISRLTYDAEVWFYNNIQTCVAYGGTTDGWCDPSNFVCYDNNKQGSFYFQGQQLKRALDNGGVSPDCPLF